MYLAHTALAVGLIYNFVIIVKGDVGANVGSEDAKDISADKISDKFDDDKDAALTDNHTFVALIDIVFMDGTKRTCTGSIVHDNVIVTAAHCFKVKNSKVQPELTASFVVIGTKAMFETGYEQYLPIERVISHPMYKGWTADLSLVYTFAGMTSDKPGTIIPIAGEKTSTHVDTNVTVLSWGRSARADALSSYEQTDTKATYQTRNPKNSCASSNSQENQGSASNDDIHTVSKPPMVTRLQQIVRHGAAYKQPSMASIYKTKNIQSKKRPPQRIMRRERAQDKSFSDRIWQNSEYRTSTTTKRIRYLTSSESDNKDKTPAKNSSEDFMTQEEFTAVQEKPQIFSFKSYYRDWRRQIGVQSSSESDRPRTKVGRNQSTSPSFKSYYMNWRRQMNQLENHLTVDNFVFINLQSCKQMVERSMPHEYDISKNNDVVCYISGERSVAEEDSGAPAVRRGQLVAVTIGSVDNDGEHIAIGMKMSCYCSWIVDNLPADGKKYSCCENCCDIKHKKEVKPTKGNFFKNKYLL